jgi:hypothetical protein
MGRRIQLDGGALVDDTPGCQLSRAFVCPADGSAALVFAKGIE